MIGRLRAGRREQQVDVGDTVGHVDERHGLGADAGGQRQRPGLRAVGHHQVDALARAGQGDGHALAHVTRAQQQHGLAGQSAQPVTRHGDGRLRDRRDLAADAGLGAGPLAALERVPQQQVELRTGGALVAGPVPGLLDLALDLALAQHGGVEPGRHREQVGGGRRVVVDVEVVGEVLGRQERVLGQEAADVAVGAVEPFGDRVHLGPVARGEHHGLADVLAAAQVVEGLGDLTVRHVHPLEQLERGSAVVQSDDDDRHERRRSLAASSRPARTSSRIPESSADRQSRSSVERPSLWTRVALLGQQPDELVVFRSELVGQAVAKPGGDRRAVPRGRHGHGQPALAQPRRQGHGAALGIVGAVDPHAGGLGIVVDLLVRGWVAGCRHHQPVAGRLAGSVRPGLGDDVGVAGSGTLGQLDDLRIQLRAHHGHAGAGLDQPTHLVQRHRPAPDHQAPPAVDDQVDRVDGVFDGHGAAGRVDPG